MALDPTTVRSRRAVLTATIGALATTVASAIGRPAIVRAGFDGDVVLGDTFNLATTETRISNNSGNSEDVFTAISGGGGHGVNGVSDSSYGVIGNSNSLTGVGATSGATDHPAAMGQSQGNSSGVQGFSGAVNSALPAARAKTGVFGQADQDSGSRGVLGRSDAGQGVRGESVGGVGGYFTSATGVALQAAGKVKLSRSGKASIAAGTTSVDVTVPGGLDGGPLPFATLLSYHAGVYVAAVRPNYPTSGVLRIYLNQAASATAATAVSWLVLG